MIVQEGYRSLLILNKLKIWEKSRNFLLCAENKIFQKQLLTSYIRAKKPKDFLPQSKFVIGPIKKSISSILEQ